MGRLNMESNKNIPAELSTFKKNKYKNTKQLYMYEERWVNIIKLAELAGLTTLKTRYLLKCGKTPKQVVEFKKGKT
jgi:hypothetical protein